MTALAWFRLIEIGPSLSAKAFEFLLELLRVSDWSTKSSTDKAKEKSDETDEAKEGRNSPLRNRMPDAQEGSLGILGALGLSLVLAYVVSTELRSVNDVIPKRRRRPEAHEFVSGSASLWAQTSSPLDAPTNPCESET
mmetsp:Transcript_24402/g.50669  ORF Transcript_24402/g.50669 Transcript_24402/m.50669 type:complete len:138 (-) Transcript_24402:166-579(-)|eukprot:CAMPEP_0171336440 /NCGR_PEP_ID=MMETSP0878-20121228/6046_1 /TAXON_ID=67004 /ORGANISM="Thalassiosira weissflogii, Strain CCMP1336" /LENGTH=137 /DNA_ID=CAMNT_0011837921 /DNA_START=467 /DNA_END=880 /DNA_ORIENTATION=+